MVISVPLLSCHWKKTQLFCLESQWHSVLTDISPSCKDLVHAHDNYHDRQGGYDQDEQPIPGCNPDPGFGTRLSKVGSLSGLCLSLHLVKIWIWIPRWIAWCLTLSPSRIGVHWQSSPRPSWIWMRLSRDNLARNHVKSISYALKNPSARQDQVFLSIIPWLPK